MLNIQNLSILILVIVNTIELLFLHASHSRIKTLEDKLSEFTHVLRSNGHLPLHSE